MCDFGFLLTNRLLWKRRLKRALVRVLKLILICEKIRRTMHGRGKVIVEDAPCQFISIMSEAPVQRLLWMARVKEWHQLQCLWIPDNLLLGRLGQCRVMAGMRRNQTIVEEDGFWIRGHDGAHEFVSVALGRDWVNRESRTIELAKIPWSDT